MELLEYFLIVITVLGSAITAVVSANQAWNMHIARAQARDSKLDADAATAVTAVTATYVTPLRRAKLARLFNVHAFSGFRSHTVITSSGSQLLFDPPPVPSVPSDDASPTELLCAPGEIGSLRTRAALYASWALALKLTPEEAGCARDQAYDLLRLDYPSLAENILLGRLNTALALSKQGTPGVLREVIDFLSQTAPHFYS